MTQQEFSGCTNLDFLVSSFPTSNRKLRLFAVACCKKQVDVYQHLVSQQAIFAAEQFADDLISNQELNNAYDNAYDIWCESLNGAAPVWTAALTAQEWTKNPKTIHNNITVAVRFAAHAAAHAITKNRNCYQKETELQCEIFRDIVNPYNYDIPSETVNSFLQWNNGLIERLVSSIYSQDRFDLMSVLADALEEAGCREGELLDHFRNGKIHVKGCWALDLLLGKC